MAQDESVKHAALDRLAKAITFNGLNAADFDIKIGDKDLTFRKKQVAKWIESSFVVSRQERFLILDSGDQAWISSASNDQLKLYRGREQVLLDPSKQNEVVSNEKQYEKHLDATFGTTKDFPRDSGPIFVNAFLVRIITPDYLQTKDVYVDSVKKK